MITPTYAVYVDWDNDGDWDETVENVTAYVYECSWTRGRDYASELTGRSTAGTCTITLHNRDGRFSSFNASSPCNTGAFSLLPGRKIKITTTYSASTVTQWVGNLESIVPQPDIQRGHKAILTAIGPLAWIARGTVSIAMQTAVTTGSAINTVLTAAGWPTGAGYRTIDTGQTTMVRFWTDERRNALEALRDIEETEGGFLSESKDGKIVFEDRAHRLGAPHTVSQATYSSDAGAAIGYGAIRQEDPIKDIYNSFEAGVRTFNISEDVVIWMACDAKNGLGGSPPEVAASGGTLTISATYPGNYATPGYVAVNEWTTLTYEANTAADGSGTDITADVSVVITKSGNRVQMVFTNANASKAYLILLRWNGTAVVEDDPIMVKDSDATSITKYGERHYPFGSRYFSFVSEAQNALTHWKAIYKDPHPVLTIGYLANTSTTMLPEALNRNISDRITIHADDAPGLFIDGDFFVERITHSYRADGSHWYEIQCSSVVTHTWAAESNTRIARRTPTAGKYVPDDLWTNAVPNGLNLVFGGGANKNNESIFQGEFRAKHIAAGTTYPESVDLRQADEGGTLAHNGTTQYIVTGLTADWSGCQYDLESTTAGRWYYAFRLCNRTRNGAGWSVWSDGNHWPNKVTSYVDTGIITTEGPPTGWSVTIAAAPTGHAVIVTATRPTINGDNIWGVVYQIKDATTGSWRTLDANAGASVVYYDGSMIDHTLSRNNTRLTNVGGPFGTASVGDLIVMDRRGSAFSIEYCEWGEVKEIGTSGSNYYVDVQGRWRTSATNDLRIKIVKKPALWQSEGYLGAEPNHGLSEQWFIGQGGGTGDTTSPSFTSDPIDVPLATELTKIQARVWFDNGWSRSDDDTYSDFCTGGGGGDPVACVALSITDGVVSTNAALGKVFYIAASSSFTLSKPIGLSYCGQPVIWIIKQTVAGSAINLGAGIRVSADIGTVTLSAALNSVDYLGGINFVGDGKFDIVAFMRNVT